MQVSNSGQSYEDRIPFATTVAMLLVDALVYLVLAWYLDKARKLPHTSFSPFTSRCLCFPAAAHCCTTSRLRDDIFVSSAMLVAAVFQLD